jgi:SM-20-related protein
MFAQDPAAHFNLFMFRNFLDPEVCETIKLEAGSAPTTQAPVYIEGSPGTIHETIRKTTSFHPSEETVSRVHDCLLQQKSLLESHFNLSLSDCETPQFLRYEVGDFFVRHQDGNTKQLDFDHLRIRRISIVVFLNEGFGGGTLNFYDEQAADGPKTFSLPGETGLLVAFTADTFHEVVPVTRGERFTIISWFR